MNDEQLFLFGKDTVDDSFRNNFKKYNYHFSEADIGDITFRGGRKEGVHRWYRLTPSFSPSLVRFFLKYFDVPEDSLILDPFCGGDTTVVECQKRGVRSIGFEINPLLELVSRYSLIWEPIRNEFSRSYMSILENKIAELTCPH